MIELRQYQIDGLTSLWKYYSNGGKGNTLLCWPTGTGKSVCPAIFIKEAMLIWPNQRFMLLTHSSELVKQDAEALLSVWNNAPLGLYCAGLKRKDVVSPIIYGTIQSAYKIGANNFGHRDILWIDEAHLISDDDASMYLKFINELKAVNPKLKVIGLTATPFRMGMGLLTEGKIWDEIVHDLTSMENFNKLILDGYLSPLIAPSRLNVKLDVSNVDIQRGEFVQNHLQYEVDRAEITWKALHETVYYGQNRRSWLIFASGIDHANHIAEMLGKLGVDCASVHSKQSSEYNNAAIKSFKNFELRSIVNFGKLTTGFNHEGIDLIDDLRPTMSVPLHVQKLGRGTRPYKGKTNCIVLDHAGNVPRLGVINDPKIPNKKGDKTGLLPIKICEACGVYNHIRAPKCDPCGHPFEFQVKIKETAGTEQLIKAPEALQIEYFDVTHVIYKRRQKEGKAPYIETTYFCGMNSFKEFQFPESKNRSFFASWWRQRSAKDVPTNADEALLSTNELRRPKKIRVHVNRIIKGKNYPEILGVEF